MLRKLKKLMGCICSKGIRSNAGNSKDQEKKLRKSSGRLVSSSKRAELVVEPDGAGNEATARLIPSPVGLETENRDSRKDQASLEEKPSKLVQRKGAKDVGGSVANAQIQQPRMGRVGSLSLGERGAQVVAGWPSWLSSVAGEAINGWIPRRADSFEKLEKVSACIFSLLSQFASCPCSLLL